MAYDGATNKFSLVAGATFSTSDLYKAVTVDSSGHAVILDTTDVSNSVIGTLYSVTPTTGGAGSEAVTVGYGPIVKAQAAASTLAAGDIIAWSTAGLVAAATTDSDAWGVVAVGSSGAAGRIFSVIRTAG